MSGYDTDNVAKDLHELMQSLGHQRYKVVGHDVGMWIAYPMAAMYPDAIERVVLSEAGIPALDPQRSWHFAFNQLVDLPEALVEGKERVYLEWLFNSFAYRPTDVDVDEYVRAYSKPGAMRAGFAYYRALPQSIEQNKKHALTPLRMPVLTVGGEHARGLGLKDMMAPVTTNLSAEMVPGAGHYPQEEAPGGNVETVTALLDRKVDEIFELKRPKAVVRDCLRRVVHAHPLAGAERRLHDPQRPLTHDRLGYVIQRPLGRIASMPAIGHFRTVSLVTQSSQKRPFAQRASGLVGQKL